MPAYDAADTAAIDLSQFDEEYARAVPAAPDDYRSDLPDGTYNAVIEEARLSETASSGRPIVIWTLRIEGPQAINRIVHRNRVITEKTLLWLKEDLEKCGLVLQKFSELPERIGEIKGRPVSFEKRTKDGRENIYFRWRNRKPPAEILDDDLPF